VLHEAISHHQAERNERVFFLQSVAFARMRIEVQLWLFAVSAGTWIASVMIAIELGLSLWPVRIFLTGADIVTVGIGLFILLPMLRVIVMLIFFLKERDYEFAAASFLVLLIIFSGFAIGTLPK
jgi:hypothetical protein